MPTEDGETGQAFELRSGLIALAIRAVTRAIALLPWRWLDVLAAPVAWLAGSLFRVRRHHVEQSMRRAGVSNPRRTAALMYRSLGRSLLEFLWMAGRPSEPLTDIVRMPNHAIASTCARAGIDALGSKPPEMRIRPAVRAAGLIIVTAHTGNWDLVGCAAAERVVPGLVVVTKRLHVSWLDRVWQHVRRSRGLCLISSHNLFRTLAGLLRAGRSVAIVIDQVPACQSRAGVETLPFAGAPALYDRLPAALSMRTGAPILMALGRRGPDGIHYVELPLALEPPARPSREWMAHAMFRMNECLDHFVREHPEQWLWLHRRWKGAEAAPPRR